MTVTNSDKNSVIVATRLFAQTHQNDFSTKKSILPPHVLKNWIKAMHFEIGFYSPPS